MGPSMNFDLWLSFLHFEIGLWKENGNETCFAKATG